MEKKLEVDTDGELHLVDGTTKVQITKKSFEDNFESHVADIFSFNVPTEEAKRFVNLYRYDFIDLVKGIESTLVDGREKSLVLTHLEIASLYLVASLARHGVSPFPGGERPCSGPFTSENK